MTANEITVKKLPAFIDERGELFVGEYGKEIPFCVNRIFFIKNLPKDSTRGNHAYLCDEFVVCCSGGCSIQIDDTESSCSFELHAGECIIIPKNTWRTLSGFSPDCILAVACETRYSDSDYIYDRKRFEEYVKNLQAQRFQS